MEFFQSKLSTTVTKLYLVFSMKTQCCVNFSSFIAKTNRRAESFHFIQIKKTSPLHSLLSEPNSLKKTKFLQERLQRFAKTVQLTFKGFVASELQVSYFLHVFQQFVAKFWQSERTFLEKFTDFQSNPLVINVQYQNVFDTVNQI